jgi:hypothetical protein
MSFIKCYEESKKIDFFFLYCMNYLMISVDNFFDLSV